MKKLALIALATSVMFASTPAFAQHRGGGARMQAPRGGMQVARPPAQRGVTWRGGGAHRGGGSWRGGGARTGGGVWAGGGARTGGGVWAGGGSHGGSWRGGHWRGGGSWGHHNWRGRHPGRHFRHHRMNRGFVIHPFWFAPQFHVMNWQMYGFTNPGDDYRWVRYYDDAYLIDRDGRVQDHRYGLDWDAYGERWEMDDGIPSYYGRNDYEPGEEDYDWAESYDGPPPLHGGEGHVQYGHGVAPGHPVPPGHGMPAGGWGYGYYGYGYYTAPIVIETTVHTGGSHEVVEEVVETRRVHRPRRAHCNCTRPAPRRPAPPPPDGERG